MLGRCCTSDDLLDEIVAENGFEDEDMISSTQYLVLAHFKRRQDDKVGKHVSMWLSLADLAEADVADETVDAKLDEWERESARRRKEDRRRARLRT